jgi:hypothetical protein
LYVFFFKKKKCFTKKKFFFPLVSLFFSVIHTAPTPRQLETLNQEQRMVMWRFHFENPPNFFDLCDIPLIDDDEIERGMQKLIEKYNLGLISKEEFRAMEKDLKKNSMRRGDLYEFEQKRQTVTDKTFLLRM